MNIAATDRRQYMMKWGPSEIATIWALVSGIVAVVAAWGGWKNGRQSEYTKTIDLLKEQVEAMQLDVDRNKALLEHSAREVFNVTVRFDQQQINYKALGAKFLEAVGRIDWLERREKQHSVRELERHDTWFPLPSMKSICDREASFVSLYGLYPPARTFRRPGDRARGSVYVEPTCLDRNCGASQVYPADPAWWEERMRSLDWTKVAIWPTRRPGRP
jgi:hypothetical protein